MTTQELELVKKLYTLSNDNTILKLDIDIKNKVVDIFFNYISRANKNITKLEKLLDISITHREIKCKYLNYTFIINSYQ